MHVQVSYSSLYNAFLFSPQRPRQCGPVRSGSWQCRWRGSADPLYPAPVLLLWKWPHHHKSLRSATAPTAAGCCGHQQKPGRARRPPLHAGYGELTNNSPLLCNYRAKVDMYFFHAIAKMLLHPLGSIWVIFFFYLLHLLELFKRHFLQFPFDSVLYHKLPKLSANQNDLFKALTWI